MPLSAVSVWCTMPAYWNSICEATSASRVPGGQTVNLPPAAGAPRCPAGCAGAAAAGTGSAAGRSRASRNPASMASADSSSRARPRLAMLLPFRRRILVGRAGDDGSDREILGARRRRRLPFEPGCAPGIGRRPLAPEHRPAQIRERQQVRGGEADRAGRGQHVEDLEFRRIAGVAARHALEAQDELRKEGQVEAEEDHHRGDAPPDVRVHPAGDLRPPVVQPGEERGHHRADHDVVEMRDDEVGVMQVHVGAERRDEQAREPPHREQADEAQRVDHRRVEADEALVQRAEPVEHLYGRRHRDHERQQREHDAGIQRRSGDEHVVAPHEERNHRDRDRGPRDELVAEDGLAGEDRDHLADDAEPGQDHDVDGRVRIEPEQVLEQQRVAAQRRVEHADLEQVLEQQQDHRHRQHRRRQHVQHRRRIQRPQEQRHPVPAHARRPQLVDRDDEVEPCGDRGIARQDDAEAHQRDVTMRIAGRQRRVEGPAGVDAAGEQPGDRQHAARDEHVPARQIHARKREVARPQHQRRDEVAERDGDRRDQEEPHHDDAMHGEQPVVHLVAHDQARRAHQVEPHQRRRRAAEKKEHRDRREVQQGDALVVGRQQPRPDRFLVGQVGFARRIGRDQIGGGAAHGARSPTWSGARDLM